MSKGFILVNKRLDQNRIPRSTLPRTCARFQLYLVRLPAHFSTFGYFSPLTMIFYSQKRYGGPLGVLDLPRSCCTSPSAFRSATSRRGRRHHHSLLDRSRWSQGLLLAQLDLPVCSLFPHNEVSRHSSSSYKRLIVRSFTRIADSSRSNTWILSQLTPDSSNSLSTSSSSQAVRSEISGNIKNFPFHYRIPELTETLEQNRVSKKGGTVKGEDPTRYPTLAPCYFHKAAQTDQVIARLGFAFQSTEFQCCRSSRLHSDKHLTRPRRRRHLPTEPSMRIQRRCLGKLRIHFKPHALSEQTKVRFLIDRM